MSGGIGGLFGSSSSKKGNSSSSTNAPLKAFQPALNYLGSEAIKVAKNYPRPYAGTTFAGPNANQTGAWGQIAGAAGQGNPLLGNIFANANQMIGGGGLSAEQRASLSPLAQYASGANLGANNGLLRENLGFAADEATSAANGVFSAGGRYGGGAHTGAVAREVGNIYNQGLLGQMNQDRQDQFAAQGLLQNVYGQGADRAAAYTQMGGALNDLRYQDANKLATVGDIQQSQQQAGYDDAQARWDAEQGRNKEALSWLQSIVTAGQPYSTQTQTTKTPTNPLAGLLGGGLLGAGILGGM